MNKAVSVNYITAMHFVDVYHIWELIQVYIMRSVVPANHPFLKVNEKMFAMDKPLQSNVIPDCLFLY